MTKGTMPALIRGTTPELEFELPFDTGQVASLYVTLAQNEAVVVDKPVEECVCNGNMLTVQLTQEETLKLDSAYVTEIQVRAKSFSGESIASVIICVNTERILKDGVI